MPLPRFLYDQDRLDLLCLDRRLRTREIHKPNAFYGQATVLKQFAGLPQRYALKGVLEHGLALRNELWEQDQNAQLPMNFAASESRATLFRALTNKPTVAIGFGYLYAMRIVERTQPAGGQRCGTLAFPCHSSQLVTCRFDHQEYAERLAALPAAMQPVVVCAYWLDYLAGNYQAYARRGIPLVTAGHLHDPKFLLRLHDLCRRFRFAVSNNIGSHLFQAVASGCRFSYLDSADVQYDLSEAEAARLDAGKRQLLEYKQLSRQLFAHDTAASREEQQRFVDQVLGTAHVKTPAALRAVLLQAEWLDKFAQARSGHSWSAPTFVQRQAARSQRICRSVSKRLPTNAWKRTA